MGSFWIALIPIAPRAPIRVALRMMAALRALLLSCAHSEERSELIATRLAFRLPVRGSVLVRLTPIPSGGLVGREERA